MTRAFDFDLDRTWPQIDVESQNASHAASRHVYFSDGGRREKSTLKATSRELFGGNSGDTPENGTTALSEFASRRRHSRPLTWIARQGLDTELARAILGWRASEPAGTRQSAELSCPERADTKGGGRRGVHSRPQPAAGASILVASDGQEQLTGL